MSYITFQYYTQKTLSVNLATEPFPQPTPTNQLGLINTGYVQTSSSYTPLYDNYGVKIGFATFDDTVSSLGYNNVVYTTETATYFIDNQGSISYTYSWQSDSADTTFPPGTTVATRILASTLNYYNKQGPIAIDIKEDGTRNVTISFNN